MCTFAGRVHLCSPFPAISQLHGTGITLQPMGFPIYTLIFFSSILQKICFCKNCLYGREELDAMSSAHQQFVLLLQSAPHPSKHSMSFKALLMLACQQMRKRGRSQKLKTQVAGCCWEAHCFQAFWYQNYCLDQELAQSALCLSVD